MIHYPAAQGHCAEFEAVEGFDKPCFELYWANKVSLLLLRVTVTHSFTLSNTSYSTYSHSHTHTHTHSLSLPLPLSLCSSPLFSSPKGYEYANYTNGECGASFTRTTDNVTVCEGVWILSKDIP